MNTEKIKEFREKGLVLRYGDSGEDVKVLQEALSEQGYFNANIGGNFKNLTRDALFWFQATHIGPSGLFLDADCEAGPNTWWALLNPSGDVQSQNIDPIIPSGLTEDRVKVLEVAIEEFKKGVHEIPDGSNWGPEIQKYGGAKGWAWCQLFVNWCCKQAFGKYPTGIGNNPSTYATWQRAIKEGKFVESNPRPGDLMMMQYKNSKGQYSRKGHVGLVLRVDGDWINCVEGNTKNQVDVTVRKKSNSKIVGWINVCGDQNDSFDYEKGILWGSVTPDDLGSTR